MSRCDLASQRWCAAPRSSVCVLKLRLKLIWITLFLILFTCSSVVLGIFLEPEVGGRSGDDDWFSAKGRRLVLHLSHRNVKTVTRTPIQPVSNEASPQANIHQLHPEDAANWRGKNDPRRKMQGNDDDIGIGKGGGGTVYAADSGHKSPYDNAGMGADVHATYLPLGPISPFEVEGSERVKTTTAVKLVYFCVNCPDPEEEGSVASGIMSYHMMDTMGNAALTFDVLGEAVYVVPNHVDHKKVLNWEQLKGRIALVKRGKIPLGLKVSRLLEKARPKAVVIIDDGQCDENFLFCGHRAGGALHRGFSAYDETDAWETALKRRIPVMMVSAATGAKFNTLMALRKVDVLGMGDTYITILPLASRSVNYFHGPEDGEEGDEL